MVSLRSTLTKHWPLLLVILIGAVLRLYGLLQNPISLYSDEVDIGYQVYSLLSTGKDYQGNFLPFQFHSFSDVRTALPIYFTALINLVGVPLDYSIRLSSAIFGILGILMTYLLVGNLVSKRIFDIELPHAGLFSALVLALIPWHITYSRIGFELSTLYFFMIFGLFLFTQYLIKEKKYLLFLSVFILGLTPMVYSTAKMAILVYPIVLLILALKQRSLFRPKDIAVSLVILFAPMLLLTVGGGIDSRFRYISIFTNPTAPAEVNYQRLLDSGSKAGVGIAPSITTKLLHNRPQLFVKNFFDNVFGLLSTDFLFVKGDPNLRHSPANSGMLYRLLLPVLLIGTFYLVRSKRDRLLIFLILLVLIPLSTSAITRDGANHASRSFMLILPLIFISGVGLAYIFSLKKLVGFLILFLLIIETLFFTHDYWYHYRFDSAGFWSYGMKEAIISSQQFPGRPIVISPKNENPLIFYAYYTRFDPSRFQKFILDHTLYNSTEGRNNLEGNRFGDTDFYVATMVDFNRRPEETLPGAIYYLTKLETINSGIRSVATNSKVIESPSGESIFYEIHY